MATTPLDFSTKTKVTITNSGKSPVQVRLFRQNFGATINPTESIVLALPSQDVSAAALYYSALEAKLPVSIALV